MSEMWGPNQYYYHSNVKRLTIAFLDILNEFKIRRWDKNGKVEKEIRVPILFGGLERATYINKEGKEVSRVVSLPMIHVNLKSVEIANDRAFAMKTLKTAYMFSKTPDQQYYYDYMSLLPYPYDFIYQVTILGKYIEDLMQIGEQLVPLFNYHRVIKQKHPVYENIDLSSWISIQGGMNFDFNTTYSAEERRDILAVPITFKIEGWMQREVYPNNFNKINQIIVNYVVANKRVMEERLTGDNKIQIMVYNYINNGLFQEGDVITGSIGGYTATVIDPGEQYKNERYSVSGITSPNIITLTTDPGWEPGEKFVLVGGEQTADHTICEVLTNSNGIITTVSGGLISHTPTEETYAYDYDSYYYDQSENNDYQNFIIIEFSGENQTFVNDEILSVGGQVKTIVQDCKIYTDQEPDYQLTDHPEDEEGIWPNQGSLYYE